MKTLVKQLTAGTFLAFLFLSGNVNANETEKVVSGHKMNETTLHLENWMTDETVWNKNSDFAANFVMETDKQLELENWMTNDLNWNHTIFENVEAETELKIESWMTSETIWSVKETAVDKKLALESWMTDSEIWK